VVLSPPKDEIISREHLAKCNGELPREERRRQQY
jgi:hypothetical protein